MSAFFFTSPVNNCSYFDHKKHCQAGAIGL
nr:MAG TPA: hypothetical protein [Caudoviricetes sp.]